MERKDKVIITQKQWANLKDKATKIDEIAEILEYQVKHSQILDREISQELNDHANKLWKQINEIDEIKW